VHGRVGIIKRPLVGGQPTVRVLVTRLAEQHELLFREPRVDVRVHHRVEGQVPGGKPRVLPDIGHRDHIMRAQVPPAEVPAALVPGRGGRLGRRVAV
jgi:hypothetical protein